MSPKYAELADTNVPRVAASSYTQYPLLVLNADRQKQIAQVTADGSGSFRLELPPGNYVLDVQGRPAGRVRAKPQPFTIASNQTIRVNMNILTGMP